MFNKKNMAFTLAEVLLTLLIIGVIATLTIPALKETSDKASNIALLRKAQGTAANAFNQLQAEYGPPLYWKIPNTVPDETIKGKRVFNGENNLTISWMLKQKMNVAAEGSFLPSGYKIKLLSGTEFSNSTKVSGTKIDINSTGAFQTADGMYWFPSVTYKNCVHSYKILLSAFPMTIASGVGSIFGAPAYAATPIEALNVYQPKSCGLIMVDTNGPKKPNRMGFDVFFFDMTTEGVLPHTEMTDDCSNLTSNGYSCASKVLAGNDKALDFIYE